MWLPHLGLRNFNKMQKLRIASNNLLKVNIFSFLVCDNLFVLLYMWSVALMTGQGWGTSEMMIANAIRNGLNAAFFFFASSKWMQNHKRQHLLGLGLLFSAFLSSALLAYFGFEEGTYILSFSAFVAATASAFVLRNFGITNILPKLQKGELPELSVAIFFLLIPLCAAIIQSLSGWLAASALHNVIIACSLGYLYLFARSIWRKESLSISSEDMSGLQKPEQKEIWHLFGLNFIFYGMMMLVKWVIFPIYVIQAVGFNPKAFGLILGLLCLGVLISRYLESREGVKQTSPETLMLIGIGITAISFVFWATFSESIVISIICAMVRNMGATLYAFGYFFVLEKADPDHYKNNLKIHHISGFLGSAIVFTLAAIITPNISDYVDIILYGFSMLIVVLTLLYLHLRKSYKVQQSA